MPVRLCELSGETLTPTAFPMSSAVVALVFKATIVLYRVAVPASR